MIRLEFERRKRGLTLRELGKLVKIQASELSRIESGKVEPFPGHLDRLSEFFKLAGEKLLEEVE